MPFNQASAWLTLSTLTSSSLVVWPRAAWLPQHSKPWLRPEAQHCLHDSTDFTCQHPCLSTHVPARTHPCLKSAGHVSTHVSAPMSRLARTHVSRFSRSARSSMLGACTHDLSAPCQRPYPMTHTSAPAPCISTIINARSPNNTAVFMSTTHETEFGCATLS